MFFSNVFFFKENYKKDFRGGPMVNSKKTIKKKISELVHYFPGGPSFFQQERFICLSLLNL